MGGGGGGVNYRVQGLAVNTLRQGRWGPRAAGRGVSGRQPGGAGAGRRWCQLNGAGAHSEQAAVGKVGTAGSRPWGECVADRGLAAAGGATKGGGVGSYCREATATRRSDDDCDTDDTRGDAR